MTNTTPALLTFAQLTVADLDTDTAAAWLRDGRHDVEDFPALGSDAGAFLAAVEDLVAQADDADLFGADVTVSVAVSCDSSGVMDGAFVFVSPDDNKGGPFLRLASLHQEHRSLTTAASDTDGLDGAVGVLEAVAATARETLRDAKTALGIITTD